MKTHNSTGLCWISFSALSIVLMGGPVLANEVSSQPPQAQTQHSEYSLHVMRKLLSDMGMSLPDEYYPPSPSPSPNPQPKPEPEPEPNPEPAPDNKGDDDFFDEDGFFDSDMSFEDAKKAMEDEFNDTRSAWEQEYQETVARWQKAKEEFQKNKETYKQGTIDIRAAAQQKPKLGNALQSSRPISLDNMKPGDFYLIPRALDVPIQNQAGRGTCAAFTGVRAMETVLLQSDIKVNLSEQHFYWLSKEDCQQTPCTDEQSGSWFTNGLENSKRNKVGVLTEVHCPYDISTNPKNETHTPLACRFVPGIRAGKIYDGLSKPQVLEAIQSNYPVMAGMRLTDNFYEDSLVTVSNIGRYSGNTDSHAGGHALLLVGLIRLPAELNEGRFCAVTANSWGDGWGVGGFGCLTEKWLDRNKIGYDAIASAVLTDRFKVSYGL
ncbi:C1 family peptidase [Alteromonas facilis]|uniref:C1 family peptidase n=1 Tax=Alteromonas facilis TaxID=2048004 RepID=UPI0013DA30CF|nr:C1 family peptidase [Alteromonas facilis]